MELTPRQSELADAALAIIAEDGMPALSFRTVAAAAGCSTGSVQKAFPSKDLMIAAAFARLREQSGPMPATEPGRPTLRGWLLELMLGLLPLDDARARTQRQGDAFAEVALRDEAVAAAITASDDEIRGLLAALIGRGQAESEVGASVDPAAAAWAVMALLQGLAAQLLLRREPEPLVRERLDGALAAILGQR